VKRHGKSNQILVNESVAIRIGSDLNIAIMHEHKWRRADAMRGNSTGNAAYRFVRVPR
jgi:hypothetical protein